MAALNVTAALQYIQAQIRALPGMRAAPDYPPEQAGAFPFAVAYLSAGTIDPFTFGKKRQHHTIRLQVHMARRDLPTGVEALMAYAESIPEALMAIDDLGTSGYSMRFPLTYTFGGMNYGGVDTIGYTWAIEIEGEESL